MVWAVDCNPHNPLPSAQRYVVTLHSRPFDPDSHLIIEKMTSTAPVTLCTVLIIAIGNAKHLKPGIPVPEHELNQQIDNAFASTARSKVYWIESIGPHWRMIPLMTKALLTTSKL